MTVRGLEAVLYFLIPCSNDIFANKILGTIFCQVTLVDQSDSASNFGEATLYAPLINNGFGPVLREIADDFDVPVGALWKVSSFAMQVRDGLKSFKLKGFFGNVTSDPKFVVKWTATIWDSTFSADIAGNVPSPGNIIAQVNSTMPGSNTFPSFNFPNTTLYPGF
jgi:hypothetical protein